MALVSFQTDSIDSSTTDPNSPSFFRYDDRIDDGDTAIIYVTFGMMHQIVVRRGQTLMMKFGALRHEFLIGKPWGSRISATAGYVYVLRPSSELWTRSLPRRTQILYTADCAYILQLLDVKPGSVICESGTGSGSLSHAIAMAVAPTGHLYTHDIDETRTKKVEQEFKTHGMSDITTAVVQNVCSEGFFVSNACDGVFLDVPAPWEAIPHAANAISRQRGGRLVSFSPCIEQVQRACEAMKSHGFVQIETVEIVPRTYKIVQQHRQTLEEFDEIGDSYAVIGAGTDAGPSAKRRKTDVIQTGENRIEKVGNTSSSSGRERYEMGSGTAIVFPNQQPTHTGYLTHATLLPITPDYLNPSAKKSGLADVEVMELESSL